MARKKSPALSAAELTAQQQQIQKQISGVQGGLLDMANVGQESYFSATQETALTKKELPNFSDIYNPLYEKMKDIRFNIGSDISTENNDAAFYVFNPEAEAKKQADLQIGEVTKQNELYAEQQKRVAEFLKQEGEAQKLGIQEQYIQSVMAKSPTLKTGYSTSTEAGFDMNAYRKAKGKNKTVSYDADRNKIYSYKLPEEVAAAKLQAIRDVETLRFRSDPDLQQRETIAYQTALEKQLADLNKKITKQTKQEAKAAKKASKKK
jgi:hypothetical protein